MGVLNLGSLIEAARHRPDLVLAGHIVVSPAALAIKGVFRTPLVQYVYAMEITSRPRLAALALSRADAVIAISRHTETLARGHGATDVRVIPPGVDLPQVPPLERFNEPTIVSVSRLDERYKGHDVLLRALPLIRARVPSARVVVVGDGALRPAYEALARALGVHEAVRFAGEVDDAERDRLLSRSHVFAMPSRLAANGAGEGFGIAYLEANAHGLPVVAGNVAGALDAVVEGETGLVVDPCDHVAVAEAIMSLLEDPAKAERLGRQGAERAKEFAWPKIAARVEDVLLEVAERPR
jgi:phosphatidylinositol alpha-1,6-mannosyltransferase